MVNGFYFILEVLFKSLSKPIDYSIQSSLFSLVRIFSAIIAGVFVSNFGYMNMFIFEAFAMFFVVFVIYYFYKS